jgi:hypothetical protein
LTSPEDVVVGRDEVGELMSAVQAGCRVYSLEWGKVIEGKVEIDSDKRRLVIILDKKRTEQLWIPFWHVKQVFAVDPPSGQPAIDLVLVLLHAPQIFAARQRQKSLDREHDQLGQVVNHHVFVSFSSAHQRVMFLDEPHTGLPRTVRRKLRVVERHLYDESKLAPVYSIMKELSDPVAFQVSGHRSGTVCVIMIR